MAWPSLSLPELLCSFFFLLYLYCCFRYFKSSKNKQPGIPVNWPVIGMMPALICNIQDLYTWGTNLLRVCGCNFYFRGVWFMNMDRFVTCDPLNIQHIFTSNFQNYPRGDDFKEMLDIFGDGILTTDGDKWQAQRVKHQQIMSHPRFRSYAVQSCQDKVEKAVLPFLAYASKHGQVIDMQDVCLRLTFDLATKLVFGVDVNYLAISLPKMPFPEAVDDAMETILVRHITPMTMWKLLRKLNIGRERKLAKAWDVIDQFIEQTIHKRRIQKKEAKETMDMPDLLSSYIDDNDSGKVDKFLRDTTLFLIVASRDTTGVGLTWFLWLLTQNRHVEEKILNELRSIPHRLVADGMVIFNQEDLAKLVYLHAAVKEALRLFPPVPFEHRGVLKDDMLPSGFMVTPQTNIFVSIYHMARMEEVWGKDCMEFKPERWISNENRLKYEPSYKFMSFITGPKTCLGKNIAISQMMAITAAVVYNFYFEVIEGHVVAPKHAIMMQMKNGLLVKIKKRNAQAVMA